MVIPWFAMFLNTHFHTSLGFTMLTSALPCFHCVLLHVAMLLLWETVRRSFNQTENTEVQWHFNYSIVHARARFQSLLYTVHFIQPMGSIRMD